jgi:ADP-heptose:LPS heptosyltransferase
MHATNRSEKTATASVPRDIVGYQSKDSVKPKLLLVELWGLGDLVIATEFLRAASEKFEVTLLAKPYAAELQKRFWPRIRVEPFDAPWSKLRNKYNLWAWPWRTFFRLRRKVKAESFTVCASSRWDPRDHLLMRFLGIRRRFGFPRSGSRRFLTHSLERPDPASHRYEQWRALGKALGLTLPIRPPVVQPHRERGVDIVVHTGAARSFCIWPLEHFQRLVTRLRSQNYSVRVLCDPSQRDEWNRLGERNVFAPVTVLELMELLDDAGVFIGNDSGPGHLAALCDVPTFTLFGPHLPEGWAPLHPAAAWHSGRPCPYKPCEDFCRMGMHHCMVDVNEEEAWKSIGPFVARHYVTKPERELSSTRDS